MELSGDILITNQLQPTLAEYLLLCPSAGWNLYTPMPSFNASKGSHYTHSESWPPAPDNHSWDSRSPMVSSAAPPLFGCPSTWICPTVKAGDLFFFCWHVFPDEDRGGLLLCPALAYLSTSEQCLFFSEHAGALKTAQDSPTVQILFFTWLRSNLGNSHVSMHGMLWLFLPIWFIQKRSQSNCPQLTKSPNIVNWVEHIDQIY